MYYPAGRFVYAVVVIENFEADVQKLRTCMEFNQVASFFCLLSSSEVFKVSRNKDFTLADLEAGFVAPHKSSLFVSLHYLLVVTPSQVKKLKEVFRGRRQGEGQPNTADQLFTKLEDGVEDVSSVFSLGKLVEKLSTTFLLWTKTRNVLCDEYNRTLLGMLLFSQFCLTLYCR